MNGALDPSRSVVRPDRVARALRNPIRRVALAVVLDWSGPVHVADLAPAVVDYAAGFGTCAPPDRREVRLALQRRHLPLLAGAGLLEWFAGGNLVRPADRPFLSRSAFDLATLCGNDGRWDALAAVFGQPRRRTTVAVLGRHGTPVTLERVARAVAAERVGELDPDASVIDDLATRLHHVDLPLLEDACVLSYDASGRRVESVSTAAVPVPVA